MKKKTKIIVSALFGLLAFQQSADAQVHDLSATSAKATKMVSEFQRKMDALLIEAGDIAAEGPEYLVGDGDKDIVTWLKENRPDLYNSNKDFLDAFSREYLGIEDEKPSGIIGGFNKYYQKVQEVADKIARRLVGAWRKG